MSKTHLITGASRGLGLEFVKQYVARGDTVIACSRDVGSTDELKQLADETGRVHSITLDLSDEASTLECGRVASERFDVIDGLVHNAGVYAPGEEGFRGFTREKMLRVFAINVASVIELTRACLPSLEKSQGAVVSAVSSGVAVLRKEPSTSQTPQYSYPSSKGALNHVIRLMAGELREKKIAVVGLTPGFVLTDMTKYAKPAPTLLPPESVSGMIGALDKVTMDLTGHYFSHKGEDLPWAT